jgi:TATA-binding protein-associated factor
MHSILTHNGIHYIISSPQASGKILALAELLRDAGIHRDELAGADNDSSLLYCNDDTEETDNYLSIFNADVESSPAIEGESTDVQHGSKCLIFAQFTRSLDVLEEFLLKPHMPSLRYLRLDGRVPAKKRTELVDSFNRDPSIKLMLLTTRAGGLGLNLTGKWPFSAYLNCVCLQMESDIQGLSYYGISFFFSHL